MARFLILIAFEKKINTAIAFSLQSIWNRFALQVVDSDIFPIPLTSFLSEFKIYCLIYKRKSMKWIQLDELIRFFFDVYVMD